MAAVMGAETSVRNSPFEKSGNLFLYGQIIAATFLQKIAIPLGGDKQIYLSFLLMLGLSALAFMKKSLEVNRGNLLFFLLMIGIMAMTQVLGPESPSTTSLFMLILLHLPYAFSLNQNSFDKMAVLEFYQKSMVIIAVLGIAQYFLQYLISFNYVYIFETQFPAQWIVHGFHGLNPLGYGSTIYKSNGVFMLEPAIFCQFLAIAVLIEVTLLKNFRRLPIFLFGIIVTFSGTGLIILFLTMPFYLIYKKHYILFLGLTILVLTAALWTPYLGLDFLVKRATEITNTQSSGYARFISMFPFIRDYILPDPATFLFGRGAGSIPWSNGDVRLVDYEIFNPTWAKIFFEYGFIGALFYFPFMAFLFLRSKKSILLKVALATQFLLLGEYALTPTVHGLILAFLVWPMREENEEKCQSG